MTADDRLLARRLAREARVAARVAARAARVQARAVARRERLVRRARRRLPYQLAVCLGAVGAVLLGYGDAWRVVAFVAAVLAVRSALHVVRPPAAPPAAVPVLPRVPPPPPLHSAAFPAVRRLEAARGAMVQLLPFVAPAGRDVAHEAWRCAAENDHALRWQAARLAAVEPHRGAEPALTELLYAGVVAQERVVVGLADLVSASADPHAVTRLQDATDALHGLAAGLREVR